MILEQKATVYLRVFEKDEVLIPFKSIRTLLLPPDCKQAKGNRWGAKRCRDQGKGRAVVAPKEDWDELTVTKCRFDHHFLLCHGVWPALP